MTFGSDVHAHVSAEGRQEGTDQEGYAELDRFEPHAALAYDDDSFGCLHHSQNNYDENE